MKKFRLHLLALSVFVTTAVLMSSCFGGSEVEYDKALLAGKWQEATLFEVYNSNGTGYTWDTADDITEAEAQQFTWTLEGDDLTQIHIMEMGGSVPKAYTLTNLTETTLSYEDDFGKSHTFSRVNQD